MSEISVNTLEIRQRCTKNDDSLLNRTLRNLFRCRESSKQQPAFYPQSDSILATAMNSSNAAAAAAESSGPATFLILNDRPDSLPAKPAAERKHHFDEYVKLQHRVRQQAILNTKQKLAEIRRQQKVDANQQILLRIWRNNLLPHWASSRTVKQVSKLVWKGIPSAIRGQVWTLLIGNRLCLTRNLFDECLEVSREHLRRRRKLSALSQPQNNSHQQQHCSCNDNTSPFDDKTSADFWQHLVDDANSGEGEPQYETCPTCSLVMSSINPASLNRRRRTTAVPVQTNGVNGHQHEAVNTKSSSSSYTPSFKYDRAANLRSIRLDISRTFPTLGLFQPGHEYHEQLHDLLAAYVAYRPEVGYVQGMSFLAAVLLLVIGDLFDAFVAFANILARPCHQAFYSLEEEQFTVYYTAFDLIFRDHLPVLHAHFKTLNLEPNVYLFDWLFTVFSRCLPLDVTVRVWDLFCLHGDLILFKTVLALFRIYQRQLATTTFDQLAIFLTSPLPSELKPDLLLNHMLTINLNQKYVQRRFQDARSLLFTRRKVSLQSTTVSNQSSQRQQKQNVLQHHLSSHSSTSTLLRRIKSTSTLHRLTASSSNSLFHAFATTSNRQTLLDLSISLPDNLDANNSSHDHRHQTVSKTMVEEEDRLLRQNDDQQSLLSPRSLDSQCSLSLMCCADGTGKEFNDFIDPADHIVDEGPDRRKSPHNFRKWLSDLSLHRYTYHQMTSSSTSQHRRRHSITADWSTC